MIIKRKLFDFTIWLINGVTTIFGEKNKILIFSNLVEKLTPFYYVNTQYGKLIFFCMGELPLWRAETLLTKEPETIEWIDSFKEGEIVWDIGANVGCYSLYTAQRNIQVIAFEPSAANYYILTKNIEINHFEGKIQGLCMAFNDTSMIGYLNMSELKSGGAMNTFGDKLESFDLMDQKWDVLFRQGMISFSIDNFIDFFGLNCPNHIKIDVDGNEDRIIKGAKKTLQNTNLKSLLIELDLNESEKYQIIVRQIENSGFKLLSKKHEETFCGKRGASVYNHVFIRK